MFTGDGRVCSRDLERPGEKARLERVMKWMTLESIHACAPLPQAICFTSEIRPLRNS